MKTLMIITLAALLALAFAPLLLAGAKTALRSLAANSLVHPDGQGTLRVEAIFAKPFLIGKRGTGTGQVVPATAGAKPLCIVEDEADAADVARGAGLACALLGATKGTKRVQAAGAVPIDTDVYSVGAGLVDVVANAAAGDYRVGRSISSTAAAGELVIVPELPTVKKA